MDGLVTFYFPLFDLGGKDSFELRAMPRNLCWWVIGISVPLSIRAGWLCILKISQKCMYCYLRFWIHFPWSILIFCWYIVAFLFFCNKWRRHWHIVICWFLEGNMVSSVLIMKMITDRKLAWETLISCGLVLENVLFMIGKFCLLRSVLCGVCLEGQDIWVCFNVLLAFQR